MDLSKILIVISEAIEGLEQQSALAPAPVEFRRRYGQCIAAGVSVLSSANETNHYEPLIRLTKELLPALWGDAWVLAPSDTALPFDALLPPLCATGYVLRRTETELAGSNLSLTGADLSILNRAAESLMDSKVTTDLRALIDQRVGSIDFQGVASALRTVIAEARTNLPIEEGSTGLRRGLGPTDEAVEQSSRVFDVWFGTNRVQTGEPLGRSFGNELDPDGEIHYGTCSVEVPRSHEFGSSGTKWYRRWLKFKFRDDHLRLVKLGFFEGAEPFFSGLREQFGARNDDERHAAIYLHGYNVSFEEAALRAAQIGFDLKIDPMSFFSWPSTATVPGYFADQDRIEASENEIADFLIRMTRESGADRVHLIAHSMGNRGLARALQRITARAEDEGDMRFGQIILAAPDLSVELFRDLAAVYPRVSQRTTLYASAKDKALAAASFLQDSDRAGYTPPITVVEGIDTVEVSGLNMDALGHGYYASAAPVLYDMLQLLQSNREPSQRPRLQKVETEPDTVHWRIEA